LLCVWLWATLSRGATFTVTTTADSGVGSLRQAILSANTNPGPNNIIFQISGTPPFTITPVTVLPSLGNPTTIDGTTQNGFTNNPVIELNGASAGANAVGLQLLSGFSTVRSLAINRFSEQGIILSGPSNTVQGNYIGTDVSGTLARANTSYGVWIESVGNLIGGTNTGNGNVISGGNDTGIFILNAGSNTIQGNMIGVAAAGTNALGNVNNGVVIDGGTGNLIGGTNSGARNVISGNGQSGIYLNGGTSISNLIQGNYIGLGASGSIVLSNAADGITINGALGNIIGGANVISGNGFSGVSIESGSSNNIILGNFIGTDSTGETALGNQNSGVVISTAAWNQLGGTNSSDCNVISGNIQDGIFLIGGATRNLIEGNLIGLSAGGTNAVPNRFNGISLSGAVSNIIGGAVTGARNVISGNTDNGVGILMVTDTLNTICGNYIGTDITGKRAVANVLAGVLVQGSYNVIGGTTAGSGNVISGNGQEGIFLAGNNGNVVGNMIQGNLIGLIATGGSGLGNALAGIGLSGAANNQIGGTTAAARNVISANGNLSSGLGGVFFFGTGTTGNGLEGNYIGTDVSGMMAVGNLNDGVYLQQVVTNFIGGSAAGAGNVISANDVDGLYATNASWILIQGNFIGTKVGGTNALRNTFHNVELDVNAINNTVGGSMPGAGNTLAFANLLYSGVRVRNGSFNNLISGNAIFSNGELGIDLGAFGVNPNYDCESGVPVGAANTGQNYPILTAVLSSGSGTIITGSLDSASARTYLLQFFSNSSGDALGYGQGQFFLGQTNLTLGAACSSNYTVLLPVSVPAGWVVTATATDPANNTSEFSAWVSVMIVPQLQLSMVNRASQELSLSWTNNGGSYALQQTFNLNPPVQWTTITNMPSLTNGFFMLAVPTTNMNAFYRLEAQ